MIGDYIFNAPRRGGGGKEAGGLERREREGDDDKGKSVWRIKRGGKGRGNCTKRKVNTDGEGVKGSTDRDGGRDRLIS